VLGLRAAQNLGPSLGTPLLPLVFIEMIGDAGRFLIAEAEVLEQLRNVEHMVVDPETLVNELLDHGRTPAGTPEPRLDWSLLNPRSESGFLRWGQFGWAAGGLRAGHGLEPIAAKRVEPCRDGLRVHAPDQGDLCKALAVQDRKDGEEVFDLAQMAHVLGCLQVALHYFTVGGRDGKTNVAHRDFPPQ
jgi:hypothetical protein